MHVLLPVLGLIFMAMWLYSPHVFSTVEFYIWIGVGLIILIVGLVPWERIKDHVEPDYSHDFGPEVTRYVLAMALFTCYVLAIFFRLVIYPDFQT